MSRILEYRSEASRGRRAVRCAKRSLRELAVFGKEPAFAQPLHVGRPNLGSRSAMVERFNRMLDRRWLTNHGAFATEFEQRIARAAGTKHCIATCNATIALELAIRAAGLKGEVIVPSFTFVATAHALQWQEITPVFCDIGAASHNIDPAQVERMITPRTTGILGVHLWGRACDIDALSRIARRHRLTLLFDAAHAFGSTFHGEPLGRFGRATVFSFHATKFLNTGEGGAIVTDDDEFARKLRLMTNFGFSGYDEVIYLGTNGKMSEAAALMGLTNLESVPAFIDANKRNHELYERLLADIPGLSLLRYDPHEHSNYQYVVVEVDAGRTKLTRDQLVRLLHTEGVIARRYFFPGVHRMEPYRSHFPHAGLLLPNTEALCERVMVLPTGTAIGPEEITAICSLLDTAISGAEDVASRLPPEASMLREASL